MLVQRCLAKLLWSENEEEAFRLAQLAVVQHDRNGSHWLGRCYRYGFGCERDLNVAKENTLMAVECVLGC